MGKQTKQSGDENKTLKVLLLITAIANLLTAIANFVRSLTG